MALPLVGLLPFRLGGCAAAWLALGGSEGHNHCCGCLALRGVEKELYGIGLGAAVAARYNLDFGYFHEVLYVVLLLLWWPSPYLLDYLDKIHLNLVEDDGNAPTGGTMPLTECRRDIPPGWSPGDPHYTLRSYLEKLNMWAR